MADIHKIANINPTIYNLCVRIRVIWYRIKLGVIDDSDCACYVVFNNETKQVLEESCVEILDPLLLKEDLSDTPTLLLNLIDKIFLFIIEVQIYDISYFSPFYKVKKMTNNVDLINKFKETHPIQIDVDYTGALFLISKTSSIIEGEKVEDYRYFQSRAILAPTLKSVEKVNDFVLTIFPGMEKEYLSSDTTCQADENEDVKQEWFTSEFLNDIKCSGLLNHKLTLKPGVAVMLLRNIDQTSGLCNGTRLIVNKLGSNVIGATVVSGRNIGDKVYIPRMNLIPSDSGLPFKFQRRQFSLTVCFAMTINMSQDQSLSHVRLYLPKSMFIYGQLYVALSRVKSRSGLRFKNNQQQH
ncbi:uncharacterized protein LOC107466684 [Arachis duranensis]|uniref:Uncharacterized protein LOC107466684 n=1 Tax=Arachis duranensis TaxID=130453 RepID=A0A6P4C2M7_ARADU|nr:uncharacterized protein LOC107466684 [Arachis duranensis]